MPSELAQQAQLNAVPVDVDATATTLSPAPGAPSPPAVPAAPGGPHVRDAVVGRLDLVREQLVLANRALVGHIVRDVLSRLPSHVDRGDLLSAGFVALTAAAISWQDHRGVPFSRYAALRIRGAVTDELRAMDWASRGVRSRARTIADARTALQSILGRTPTDAEVRTATGFSQSEVEASAADIARAGVLSLHTPTGADGAAMVPSPAPDPAELLVDREAVGYLDDAIEELPDRLRFVIRRVLFRPTPHGRTRRRTRRHRFSHLPTARRSRPPAPRRTARAVARHPRTRRL